MSQGSRSVGPLLVLGITNRDILPEAVSFLYGIGWWCAGRLSLFRMLCTLAASMERRTDNFGRNRIRGKERDGIRTALVVGQIRVAQRERGELLGRLLWLL